MTWQQQADADARAAEQIAAAYPGEPALEWLRTAASERGWTLARAWTDLGWREEWRPVAERTTMPGTLYAASAEYTVAVRRLGREIVAALRLEQIVSWLSRRLTRQ